MIRLPIRTVNGCCGFVHDGRDCKELVDCDRLFGCVVSITPNSKAQPLQLARKAVEVCLSTDH